MSQYPTYEDDTSLNNLLDGLIASAKDGQSALETDATTSQQDVTFTPDSLHEGIEAANALFTTARIQPYIPVLGDETKSNCLAVSLAASLTVLVRITRANQANITLRHEAQQLVQDVHKDVERLQEQLMSEKARSEVKADAAATARRQMQSVVRSRDDASKRHGIEITELRARLASMQNKEKVFIMDAKRREKESGMLKQRVHSIMKTPRGSSVLPHITLPENGSARNRAQPFVDVQAAATRVAEEAKNNNARVAGVENEQFRDLLRAVQEELDDLVLLCDLEESTTRASSATRASSGDCTAPEGHESGSEEGGDGDDGDDGGDGEKEAEKEEKLAEGAAWEDVLGANSLVPAPSEEQMNLPFEVIREEFEKSLEKKFNVVREALNKWQAE